MKNAINAILKHIYYRIPQQILIETFRPHMEQTRRTLDAVIKEIVIVDYVLFSCNLYAGKTKKIILEQRFAKRINDNVLYGSVIGEHSGVYAIPPEYRENRAITAVLDIAFPTTMAFYGNYPNIDVTGRSVANGAEEALSSFTHTPAYVTPTPILLDGDAGLIQLSPPVALHVDWVLSCMLAYDKNLINVSPNILILLKNMSEYATKAYIYNELYIKINQGYLQGGLQLESIRSIVESYADAHEKFEEFLLKFRGAANFSNTEFKDFISLLIGS